MAPWGERAEPDVRSMAGLAFFNPFTSRETNSARFIKWQFERATTAVYGYPMTIAEYDNGQVRHPARVTMSPRMLILNAGAAIATFLLLMCVGERQSTALPSAPRTA